MTHVELLSLINEPGRVTGNVIYMTRYEINEVWMLVCDDWTRLGLTVKDLWKRPLTVYGRHVIEVPEEMV